MNYVNLTPHAINLNDGRTFPPSGIVARVSTQYTKPTGDIVCVAYGEIENLPGEGEGEPGTCYIVSGLVLAAAYEEYVSGRRSWVGNIVAPATGHPETIRDGKGQVVSVPYFVRM